MESFNQHIIVTYHEIRKHKFETIDSPYLFTPPRIYIAEFLKVHAFLKENKLTAKDVTEYAYITGLFNPYMILSLPLSGQNGYEVVIKIKSKLKQLNADKTDIENIRDVFLSAITTEEKKLVYRKLMNKHHPDKGGSEKLTKYINSFKTWK